MFGRRKFWSQICNLKNLEKFNCKIFRSKDYARNYPSFSCIFCGYQERKRHTRGKKNETLHMRKLILFSGIALMIFITPAVSARTASIATLYRGDFLPRPDQKPVTFFPTQYTLVRFCCGGKARGRFVHPRKYAFLYHPVYVYIKKVKKKKE